MTSRRRDQKGRGANNQAKPQSAPRDNRRSQSSRRSSGSSTSRRSTIRQGRTGRALGPTKQTTNSADRTRAGRSTTNRGGRLRLGRSQRRLQVGFILIILVALVFAGRLLQVQGVDAAAFADRATGERLRTVALPATRGDIVDTSGTPLATTVDAYDVTADPTLTEQDAPRIAAVLAPLLDTPAETLQARLTEPDTRFVYLARQVEPQVWESVSSALSERGLSGVFRESNPKRIYPSDGVGSNVVGFLGADGEGLAGLEHALDNQLHGQDGTATYEIGAGGRQIPLANSAHTQPQPGAEVQLTLDRDIQWMAQQAIDDQVADTGAARGEVTVLDIETGELVASATTPGYDANDPTAATDEERGNAALQNVYEPGSVVKPLTAAAAIDAGHVAPDTKITVPGSLTRDGEVISDYWSHGTINLTMAGALAESSNIATVLAAERMAGRELRDYLSEFGLGDATGIGFPGESAGLLPQAPWSNLTRATVSFGQGLSVNAVQMAAAVATIANDGVYVEPSVVKQISGADGSGGGGAESQSRRVVSKQAARAVTAMMEQVTTSEGVAPQADVPGYRVAGKTGTAQRVDPACGCYNGYTTSFVGFAPAEDPKYLVYSSVHDPQGESSGATTAAPVFSDVMAFTLQKYGVPPAGEPAPDIELEW